MIALALIWMTTGLASVPDGKSELDHALQQLAEAFLANRSAFAFGVFRGDHITGKAQSSLDAREGRIEESSTGRFLYAFDGVNSRHDRLYDDAVLLAAAQKLGGSQSRSSIHSFRIVSDGKTRSLMVFHHRTMFPESYIARRSTPVRSISTTISVFP